MQKNSYKFKDSLPKLKFICWSCLKNGEKISQSKIHIKIFPKKVPLKR